MFPLWSLVAQAQTSGAIQWIDKLARAPISKIVIFAAIGTAIRVLLFNYLTKTPPHQRFGSYKAAQYINEFSDAVVYSAIVVFMLVRPFAIQTFVIPSGSMVDTLRLSDYIVANKWVYRVSDPQYGDIIVFKPPKQGLVGNESPEDTDYIKRLIGKPGDVIELKDKIVYRNGVALDEPYVDYTLPGPHNNMDEVMPKADWPNEKLPDWKLAIIDGKPWPVQMMDGFTDYAGFDAPRQMQNLAPEYRTEDPEMQRRLKEAPPAKIPPGYYLFMGDNRNGSYDGRAWGLVPRESIVGKAWFIWMPVSRFKWLDISPKYPDSPKK